METPWLDAGLRVIDRAETWAAVLKPAGLLSVPGKGPDRRDCVASRVGRLFPTATGPIICHRLDMETSGVMVVALTIEAHRVLSGQFERREVEKTYVALLPRDFTPIEHSPSIDPLAGGTIEGLVELPIRPDLDRRPVQIVDRVHGRAAASRWRVVGEHDQTLRVRWWPITGRTHQLRVHAAAGLGRPIVGDSLYGGARAGRLMLHACELGFDDPATGQRRVVVASPEF